MFRLVILGLCVTLVAPPAPVAAQAPAPAPGVRLGTRIPVPEDTPGQREAAQVLQRFARCLVNRDPDLAAAVVDPPHSNADTERLAQFRRASTPMSNCLTSASSMAAGHRLMTGAFAEQLYRRRHPLLPVLGPAESLTAMTNPDNAAFVATLDFANCLIDASAADADALVRSSIGSRQEAAALQALSGRYAACLNAGSTLVLNRLALRMALADQLYRRARSVTANPPTRGSP